MAVNLLLKAAVQWIVVNFGKDILVVLKGGLQHQWRRMFAARNILVLGPKQSGKSSLVQYLTSGRPYEIVDGEVRPPAPTALAAVVDERFSVQKGNWLKLKRDVPGDIDLRDAWAQAMTDIQPHGIIYMIDGRRDDEAIRADVVGIREFVLDHYSTATGHLAALHVFMNFADYWGSTSAEQRRRVRVAREALEEVTAASPEWASLRIGVAPTQLGPHKKSWEEVARALHHFGADLGA